MNKTRVDTRTKKSSREGMIITVCYLAAQRRCQSPESDFLKKAELSAVPDLHWEKHIITIVITVTMHEDCSGHSILAERWEGLPLCFAYFSACIRITATHSRLSGCPEMVNAYTQGRSHFATLTVKCLSWSSAFQLH